MCGELGDLFQEAEGHGISTQSNAGEVEGGGCAEDGWGVTSFDGEEGLIVSRMGFEVRWTGVEVPATESCNMEKNIGVYKVV